MTVEATLLIEFGGTGDPVVTFELDDILNNDETSFAPGAVIYMRLTHTADVDLEYLRSTDGSVSYYIGATREAEESFTFKSRSEVEEFTLTNTPISGSLVIETLGRDGPATASQLTNGQVKLTGDVNFVPYKVKATYKYTCKVYRLFTPSDVEDEYPITIVAYFQSPGGSDECNS